ncbi:MAG TPA: hypothetical protein EYP04_10170 [Anaerolineae bacterium]|nr:hypothetical protein [Anaerolineae bacterium]
MSQKYVWLLTLVLLLGLSTCARPSPTPTTALPTPTATLPAVGVTLTLAGGEGGYAEGNGTEARFSSPSSVVVDASGNVYVADAGNHRIRRIAPDGVVTTLAGNGEAGTKDGKGTEAEFGTPGGLTLDAAGNLYVADTVVQDPHPLHIRKVTPDGEVTTIAGTSSGYVDGPVDQAQFRSPADVTVDEAGNLYVADTNNHRIRRISAEGQVTTFAGKPGSGFAAGYADGPAADARFNKPQGIAVDQKGNVYVADTGNQRIRVITPDGQVRTLAGTGEAGYADGPASSARFNYPMGIAVDAKGNVYVADSANHRIRKIAPDGIVSTVAGSGQGGYADGLNAQAQFRLPTDVAVGPDGALYVADSGNHRIRKVVP